MKSEKVRFRCNDVRTGFAVGEIVELTSEELSEVPFNVFMERIFEEETELIGKAKLKSDKDALKDKLTELGLSPNRSARQIAASVKGTSGNTNPNAMFPSCAAAQL